MGTPAPVHEPVATETAALLWAVARPDADVHAIRAALDAGADLDRVATVALPNGVGPLCWRALGLAGARGRLGAIAEPLERDAEVRRVHAQLLLPIALQKIVGPLGEAGLEPLIFKGPAMAEQYAEPGLRPMDDVDVILPKRQHGAGLAALERAGWRTLANRPGDHYDTFLSHPDVPYLPLELHWDVAAWHDRATNVSAEALWKSRRTTTMLGVDCFGLPPEENLVALANHAGKPFHHFGRLIWSVDMAVVIINAAGQLDWDRVASMARRWHCRTVLAVALLHARRFGADVPDPLLILRSGRTRTAAIRPVLAQDWHFVEPDDSTTYRLRYAFSDSKVRRAELLLGEITAGAHALDVPGRLLGVTKRLAKRWRADHSGGVS